jgi:hypothetical protein
MNRSDPEDPSPGAHQDHATQFARLFELVNLAVDDLEQVKGALK